MDMRTHFCFGIDDAFEEKHMFSWQEGLEFYLEFCSNNGFEIDEEMKKRLITMAKLRKVEF